MATRNPVSVLPEPVGEATRTSRPSAMCGQAAVWGGVGPAGNRRANQLATAGWNNDSGDGAVFTVLFHQDVVSAATWPGSGRRASAPARDHGWLGQVEMPGPDAGQVALDLVGGGDTGLKQLVTHQRDRRN